MNEDTIKAILDEAREAADRATKAVTPTPMVVGMGNLFDDSIVPGTEEIVEEGVCGYAWVKISGRGKFAKYLKDQNMASKSCTGPGYIVWATALQEYRGQSYERNQAGAAAVAGVFNKHGIKAQMFSRLD